MCKRRWRPYLAPSPAQILSRFGPELGQAIIEKNTEAVSAAAIAPGKWLVLIGSTLFPLHINGTIIPASFPDAQSADLWLQGQLPLMDLRQPECIERSAARIAYRTYSPLTQEYTEVKAIAITPENREHYQQAYGETAKSWRR